MQTGRPWAEGSARASRVGTCRASCPGPPSLRLHCHGARSPPSLPSRSVPGSSASSVRPPDSSVLKRSGCFLPPLAVPSEAENAACAGAVRAPPARPHAGTRRHATPARHSAASPHKPPSLLVPEPLRPLGGRPRPPSCPPTPASQGTPGCSGHTPFTFTVPSRFAPLPTPRWPRSPPAQSCGWWRPRPRPGLLCPLGPLHTTRSPPRGLGPLPSCQSLPCVTGGLHAMAPHHTR